MQRCRSVDEEGKEEGSQAQAAMTNESDAGWSTDEMNGRSQASSSVSYLQHKDTAQSERIENDSIDASVRTKARVSMYCAR